MLYILAQAEGGGAEAERIRIDSKKKTRKTRSSGRRNKCQGNTSLPRQKAGVTNNSQQKATHAKKGRGEREREGGRAEKQKRERESQRKQAEIANKGVPTREKEANANNMLALLKAQKLAYFKPKIIQSLYRPSKRVVDKKVLRMPTKKILSYKLMNFSSKTGCICKKTAELNPRKVCYIKPNGNDSGKCKWKPKLREKTLAEFTLKGELSSKS